MLIYVTQNVNMCRVCILRMNHDKCSCSRFKRNIRRVEKIQPCTSFIRERTSCIRNVKSRQQVRDLINKTRGKQTWETLQVPAYCMESQPGQRDTKLIRKRVIQFSYKRNNVLIRVLMRVGEGTL